MQSTSAGSLTAGSGAPHVSGRIEANRSSPNLIGKLDAEHVATEAEVEQIKEQLPKAISSRGCGTASGSSISRSRQSASLDCLGSTRDATPASLVQIQHELSRLYAESTEKMAKDVKTFPIVDDYWFSILINTLVGLNTLQMGAEAEVPEWEYAWTVCENVFTGLFLVEAIIKLVIMRREYFADWSNWLDLTLVFLGIIDCWIFGLMLDNQSVDLQSLSILRILRLFRLVRVLRLVKNVKKFVLVVSGVIQAVQTTFWVSGLLLLVIYVSAIFCTDRLGRGKDAEAYPGWSTDENIIYDQEIMANYNPHLAFGNLWCSMVTLFNIAIMAEWPEVVRPVMIKQPVYILFFIMFALLVTFGVMNVIIGMIVDNVINDSKELDKEEDNEERRKQKLVLAKLQNCIFDIDKNQDGLVTLEELRESMRTNRKVVDIVTSRQFPVGWQAEDLLSMLDDDGDGVLSQDEFIKSYFRLVDASTCNMQATFQHICIMQGGINNIKYMIRQAFNRTVERLEGLESRVDMFMKESRKETANLNESIMRTMASPDTVASERLPKAHPVGKEEKCRPSENVYRSTLLPQHVESNGPLPCEELKSSVLKAPPDSPEAKDTDPPKQKVSEAMSNDRLAQKVSEELKSDPLTQKVLDILDTAYRSVRESVQTELGSLTKPELAQASLAPPNATLEELNLKEQREEQFQEQRQEHPPKSTSPPRSVTFCEAAEIAEIPERMVMEHIVTERLGGGEDRVVGSSPSLTAARPQTGFGQWGLQKKEHLGQYEADGIEAYKRNQHHRLGFGSQFTGTGKGSKEDLLEEIAHLRENVEARDGQKEPTVASDCVPGDQLHQHERSSDIEHAQTENAGFESTAEASSTTIGFLFEGTDKLGFEVIWKTDGPPEVGAVHPGQCADLRGVQRGDRLIASNGMPTSGRGREDILQLLKGRPLLLQVERRL